MKLVLVLGLGVVAMLAVAPPDRRDPCAPQGERSADLVAHYTTLATATDSFLVATRDSLRIPAAAASDVVLVVDEAVCQTAASAYTAAAGDSISQRSVHVLRIGSRYLVVDPTKWAGHWTLAFVFDSTFATVLGKHGT